MAPYIFTKVMKPVFTMLRKDGVCSLYYIDDSIFTNSDPERLHLQTLQAIHVLESLGFVLNYKKSICCPTSCIQHLGFLIDSQSMTVSLPGDKLLRLTTLCNEMLSSDTVCVRKIAQATGLIVSSFLAFPYGQLHYRDLEMFKVWCLEQDPCYDRQVVLSSAARRELRWWLGKAHSSNGKLIGHILGIDSHADDLFTDASKSGWGAALVRSGKVIAKCSGEWTPAESKKHINILELMAIHFGLCSLGAKMSTEVCVNCDNTTAIAYVNRFGGCHSIELNALSKTIWQWCIDHGIHIQATHVAGCDNVMADSLSRNFNANIEWSLEEEVFHRVCERFGMPSVDLFASRINHKLPVYFPWHVDPGCAGVNALGISWDNFVWLRLSSVQYDRPGVVQIGTRGC